MAKGATKIKYSNNAMTLSYAVEKNSERENCLGGKFPSRKPRLLIIFVFVTVLSFGAGLAIGFFTRSRQVCEGTKDVHVRQHEGKLEQLLHVLDKENIRANIRYFSSEPHVSGSQRSKELADEIRRRWDSYGFKVDTVEYDVLLPRAKDGNPDYIEIRDDSGEVTLRHQFAAVGKSDPSSKKNWTIPRYFFYSPSGSSDGGLLYVNEGRKKDFDYLKKINITSCNNSVLLVKFKFALTLEQLKNAHDCNASGLLYFSEKRENWQTSGNGSVYPDGPRLPEEQPLAFILRNDWFGDPLTPDLPSSEGIYRLDESDAGLLAKLPVQIVEYRLAKKLLQLLQGSPLPEKWKLQSGDNDDYRIGPSLVKNSVFHLTVNSRPQTTKIYDVIGTVYGREEPDKWVLVGNHRDSITFGAGDAGSGTAGMMELSRGIGELLKQGWRPRRTIKLCSWAAEETGIIGATEFVEDNKKLLQERAVAYINTDMLVHGNGSMRASGNPLLKELVYSQSMKVEDPHGADETMYSVWKKARPWKDGRPKFTTIGLGSDYIPFYEMAGVPSIDLQYGSVPFRLPQAYHTVYDTYHYMSMIDPHFHVHLAQTKLMSRIVYALSNSPLVPFNLNSFTTTLREIVNRTTQAYEKTLIQHGVTLKGIAKEAQALQREGGKFEKLKNESKREPNKIRQLNRRMVAFNKLFISPEGIPGRFSMRNLVLGISQNDFYPNITLAGVSDAVIAATTSGRWKLVKRQVSLTQHAITQARRSLEMP